MGHIATFGLFNFSFGYRLPKADFNAIYSWGTILQNHDLIPRFFIPVTNTANSLKKDHQIYLHDKTQKQYLRLSEYYLKPQTPACFNKERLTFKQNLFPAPFIRKGRIITFHPHLPVNFLLFFKDRQTVHIELMFNIISSDRTNSILIKREISSGNLEADLLSMRYINHYLFLQQFSFTKDSWQTVKIDLSAKND